MDFVSPVLPFRLSKNGTDRSPGEIDLAKDQPQFQTLPAMICGDGHTLLFSAEVTDEDLERIKESRRIYFYQTTYGRSFQPVKVMSEAPEFVENEGVDQGIVSDESVFAEEPTQSVQ